MSLVVACPNCQRKARVAAEMVGQAVKCPGCAATFQVPADAKPPAPSEAPVVMAVAASDAVVRPPLPADIDGLRSVRAGIHVQLAAHIVYAIALAMFALLLLMAMADKMNAGMGPSRISQGKFTQAMPALLATGALITLAIGSILSLAGGALCVLAPTARLARGLAIGSLLMTTFGFQYLISAFGWAAMMSELGGNSYFGPRSSFLMAGLSPLISVWLFDVARLTLLAFFWKAMNQVLHDARGAAVALRLAVTTPIVHVGFFLLTFVFGYVGDFDKEVMIFVLGAWLALQLLLLIWGMIVLIQLGRRLRAAELARP